MTEIKAIETYYNGYRFRSRLEARWAVFFDAMGIRYEYEHEGFERHLNHIEPPVRYLPDFWFPEYELFGEVKGVSCRGQIPREDAEKMSWMIDFNGPCSNGIVLLGNIPNPNGAVTMEWAIWRWSGESLEYGYTIGDWPCMVCFEGIGHESAPHSFKESDDLVLTSALYFQDADGNTIHDRPVERALAKARQARFEHGESPTI